MSANHNPLEREDPREYAGLLAGFIAEYRPQGGLEQELVRQITSATHRLRRLDRVENAAMVAESMAHSSGGSAAIAMERFTSLAALLARLGRARIQAERAFNRAYKDLEERRACRVAEPISQNKPKFIPEPVPQPENSQKTRLSASQINGHEAHLKIVGTYVGD
jgi:hypothetical protein